MYSDVKNCNLLFYANILLPTFCNVHRIGSEDAIIVVVHGYEDIVIGVVHGHEDVVKSEVMHCAS